MKKLNISRAVVSRGASLLVVSIALVAAYVAISMNMTLGWFAKNNTVTASGMVTQAYDANFQVSYQRVDTDSDEVLSKDFLAAVKVPGQSITFTVTVTNVGLYPAEVTSVGLKLPTAAQDVPIYDPDQDEYRYLSTELTTEVLKATTTNTAYTLEIQDITPGNTEDVNSKFLRTEENGAQAINYFDWLKCTVKQPAETGDTVTYASTDVIILAKGESITFTIKITFEDKGNQNVYKNYVEKGGTCVRDIYITYN